MNSTSYEDKRALETVGRFDTELKLRIDSNFWRVALKLGELKRNSTRLAFTTHFANRISGPPARYALTWCWDDLATHPSPSHSSEKPRVQPSSLRFIECHLANLDSSEFLTCART